MFDDPWPREAFLWAFGILGPPALALLAWGVSWDRRDRRSLRKPDVGTAAAGAHVPAATSRLDLNQA